MRVPGALHFPKWSRDTATAEVAARTLSCRPAVAFTRSPVSGLRSRCGIWDYFVSLWHPSRSPRLGPGQLPEITFFRWMLVLDADQKQKQKHIHLAAVSPFQPASQRTLCPFLVLCDVGKIYLTECTQIMQKLKKRVEKKRKNRHKIKRESMT